MSIHLSHIVQPILDAIHNHPYIGQLAAFIIAFIESLPIIGTIFPGSITMTAIGTLIGAGLLPGFETLAWASLGALMGDALGFWVGRYYNEGLKLMWPFKKYPHWLLMGENFFKKHGGKSILIGRFFGPVRSTIPLMAGLLKLTWARFLIAAIPSAILWAIVYMFPGIVLGALALELPASKMTEFILFGLLIICTLWFLLWLIEKFFRSLIQLANSFIDQAWKGLQRHHASSLFITLIRNRQNNEDHHQLTLTLLGMLCALFFIFLTLSVRMKATWVIGLNSPLFHLLQSIRISPLDIFFTLISLFGSPIVMGILCVGLCAALLLKKQYREFSHFFGAFLFAAISGALIKHWVHSPRPSGFITIDPSLSYPSGHSLMSLVVLGLFAYFATRYLERKWHGIVYSCAISFMVLDAFSRIYIGAHWFTDVLGAWLLGLTIIFLTLVSYRRRPYHSFQKSFPAHIWLLTFCFAWMIPGLAYTTLKFNNMRYAYTPYSIQFYIGMAQWWNDPFEYLPVLRNNRFGHPVVPFNLHWLGSLPEIESALEKTGWKPINHIKSVKTAIQRLAGAQSGFHMSIFSWLYLNKPPALRMIKQMPHSNTTVELRLWETQVYFTDCNVPLWIGTVNFHFAPNKLLTRAKKSLISFAPPNILEFMKNDFAGLSTKVIIADHGLPQKIHPLNWNGEVLLVRNHCYDAKP